MSLEPGQNLGHYRVERKIGQGGMGAVFLAEDTKLGRKVALKVLPPETATDADRLERFRREAKAVAALNHPHIVTLHSVEEEGGTHFITMELVEGERLDHDLPPGGLPLPQLLEVGVALADALAAAHDKGIIHRDLKPANVMLTTAGRVKVLDFGLARASSGTPGGSPAPAGRDASSEPTRIPGRDLSQTAAGMVMGTLPYMSPEQLGGETVDARTDIFSLGVVLYELATGLRPFGGKNPAEIISSILRDAPRPVTEARPDAPPHLGRILDRCLRKRPRDRFPTARNLFEELRALRGVVGTGPGTIRSRPWFRAFGGAAVVAALTAAFWFGSRPEGDRSPPSGSGNDSGASATATTKAKSIAVLPFLNMSDDAANEYFSDGISEELMNLLAKLPELRVISRSSSFFYKGKDIQLARIAEDLNVAHILEGSVRKAGKQVRITAQLIDADSDTHLWSETYDRTLDDIFAIQDEIAAAVVAELKITLLGEAPKVEEPDPEAYALFLQARHLHRLGTAEGYEQSVVFYERALAIDPEYAASWDGLAVAYISLADNGLRPFDEGYRTARDMAEKALAIDPDFAKAHGHLGWIERSYANDPAAAARHYQRALELDPADLGILGNAASLLSALGRVDQALALQRYASARDPVAPIGHANLGFYYLLAGRWDETIASSRTALRLSPGYLGAHYQIGLALLMKGDPAAALEEFAREADEEYQVKGKALALHSLGRLDEFEAALSELIDRWGEQWPSEVAHVYALTGHADGAFVWLEKEFEKNGAVKPNTEGSHYYTRLKDDPRWLPLLERSGTAPDQLDAIEFHVPLSDR